MNGAQDPTGAWRAASGWRAASETVRVRWSGTTSPWKRALLMVLGVLIMIGLTVVGVFAVLLAVVGAALMMVVVGLRRAWWGIIGRPVGGPNRAQNELRRNVRVREPGGGGD